MLTTVPPARHLLRAKDLIDGRYRESLDVPTLARAARLSPELPAEMTWGDVSGACECLEIEWLGVAAVDDVAGPEQMAGEGV